ncbi:hypothetical protein HH212_03035 [Massilia forsythiae]|uniref:Uncharacterized protein n=1 Tax=Massilia forsythiae TaxID=2728020 RepID=A0A7Z2VTZ2_9BURK|nr:hypothetical protein [Massilia forsythiae]QJD99133.1 hypothetical protein HH212_03035 [Massilia forsythiae]
MPVTAAACGQGRGQRFGKPGGAPASAAAVACRPRSLLAGALLCALLVPACAAARAQTGTDVPTYVGFPVTGQVDDEKVRAARYGTQAATATAAAQPPSALQATPAPRAPRQMEPPVSAPKPADTAGPGTPAREGGSPAPVARQIRRAGRSP